MPTLIMLCIIQLIKFNKPIHNDVYARYQNIIDILKSKFYIEWCHKQKNYYKFKAIDFCNVSNDNSVIVIDTVIPKLLHICYYIRIKSLTRTTLNNINHCVDEKEFGSYFTSSYSVPQCRTNNNNNNVVTDYKFKYIKIELTKTNNDFDSVRFNIIMDNI